MDAIRKRKPGAGRKQKFNTPMKKVSIMLPIEDTDVFEQQAEQTGGSISDVYQAHLRNLARDIRQHSGGAILPPGQGGSHETTE